MVSTTNPNKLITKNTSSSNPNQKWTYYSSTGQIKGIANKCLDSGSGTLNQILRINTCHGGNNQKWNIATDGGISQNTSSGTLCISTNNSSVSQANPLYLGSCDTKCGAYWNYNGSSTGSYVGGCGTGVSSGSTGTTGSGQGQGSQPSQPAPSNTNTNPSAGQNNGNGSQSNSGSSSNNQTYYDDSATAISNQENIDIYNGSVGSIEKNFNSNNPKIKITPDQIINSAYRAKDALMSDLGSVFNGVMICSNIVFDSGCTAKSEFQVAMDNVQNGTIGFVSGLALGIAVDQGIAQIIKALFSNPYTGALGAIGIIGLIYYTFNNINLFLYGIVKDLDDFANSSFPVKMFLIGFALGGISGVLKALAKTSYNSILGLKNIIQEASSTINNLVKSTDALSLKFVNSLLPNTSLVVYNLDGTARILGKDFINFAKYNSDDVVESALKSVDDGGFKATFSQLKNELARIKNPSLDKTFSTGRTIPNNLKEQIAMKTTWADPLTGATNLRDKLPLDRHPVYNDINGWEKWQKIVDGVNIHFTRNKNTGEIVDFKFKN